MNITFELILNQLCSYITKVSTTVGSFTYIILSALTFRLLDIETRMYSLKQNMKVDTADDSAIDDLASNRGIIRKQATIGIARGKFNIEVPIGAKFQIGEVVWITKELISNSDYYYYKMESEQTGNVVNKAIGKLTAITYIEGLNYAYIENIIIPAEDVETTDSLRERYKASFNSKSFGGNKIAYKEYVEAISGVGGCKVYPLKNGNGTVGLTVINSIYDVPNNELINAIQEQVDPSKTGNGEGIAPIGAIVTVIGVAKQNIKIGIKCQFQSGNFEDWKDEIERIIIAYFHGKNTLWANSSEIVIRKAEIISEVIKSECVIDVTELLINDLDSNLVLTEDKIAYLNELVEIM